MSSFYVFLSFCLELLIQLIIKFYWMMDGMVTISSRITHIIDNRYQFVLFGDNFQSRFPQGSTLRPLLFVIYLNDLCDVSKVSDFIFLLKILTYNKDFEWGAFWQLNANAYSAIKHNTFKELVMGETLARKSNSCKLQCLFPSSKDKWHIANQNQNG